MADDTQTADEPTTPTAYGWCAWHENYARGVRLIGVHEQGSGPGGNLFACPTCRATYDLTPLADLPL